MTHRFYYQPDLYCSIIFWSWTFIILFSSATGWLEITTIQWFTVVTFILFLIVAGLGIFRRQLFLNVDQATLTLQQILPKHRQVIPLKALNHVVILPHGVRFELERLPNLSILMTKKQKQRLVETLKTLKTETSLQQN